MRAFPLAGFLYCAVPLYLPPPRGFIAGPKYNPEARRTPYSTFQPGVHRLIGGCDDSRCDVSLAEGVFLVETPGAVRARGLVRTINSSEFVGADNAFFSKLTRVVSKALKGLKCTSACTAESLGVCLISPVFGEAPRL